MVVVVEIGLCIVVLSRESEIKNKLSSACDLSSWWRITKRFSVPFPNSVSVTVGDELI